VIAVSRDSRWSSLLTVVADNEQARVVSEETVPVTTLNEVPLVQADDRVLLKLDVQGYELEVLAGADRLLPKVVVAQAEVTLRPTYEGQPSRDQLFAAFERVGLRLAGVERGGVDTATGEDLYFDALFVRDPSPEEPVSTGGDE
jgi:hypothetical protein